MNCEKKRGILIPLIIALVLMAIAIAMYFIFPGIGEAPFWVAGVSVLILLFLLRRNWAALCGGLIALALVLRFAMRGYGWWAYICLFIAALIVLHRFLPPVPWKIVVALVCLGLAYFCFVESFIIRSADTDPDPERDYLIVLGAAVHGDQPSLTLIRRIEGAMDYLEKYPRSIAIVSGGQGPGENMTEAQAMYDYMTAHGVDPARIILEPESTSTEENLSNSFAIIRKLGGEPQGRVAIVSSAYHLYRAKLFAAKLGVDDAAGVSAPWGYFLVMINYFIREAFGVTHFWVFGN